MQLKQVNQEFYVADQISQRDVAELANKGIKTIICNRPDGEGADQPNIIEGQIIQGTLQDFTVRVVATEDFSVEDEVEIRTRMWKRLGSNVNINIEMVDSIERSASGKFKAVISKVK